MSLLAQFYLSPDSAVCLEAVKRHLINLLEPCEHRLGLLGSAPTTAPLHQLYCGSLPEEILARLPYISLAQGKDMIEDVHGQP